MIETYIHQPTIVDSVLTCEDLARLSEGSGQVSLMMGQTFDEGQPFDMLKYGLFMMNMVDFFKAQGSAAQAYWMIADHFLTDINRDVDVQRAAVLRDRREGYLNRMNAVYSGDILVVRSSELSKTHAYQSVKAELVQKARDDPHFREEMLRAVPDDRKQVKDAVLYPLEELATIFAMGADVKVGPVYERFYDVPARQVSYGLGHKPFVAVHLSRSLPFGNPVLDADLGREVSSFGVLPYKLNSKGLAPHRIDAMSSDMASTRALLNRTSDPYALVDLLAIGEMAEQRLEGAPRVGFFGENGIALAEAVARGDLVGMDEADHGLPMLRGLAAESYARFIHKPMRS
ncbi:MAG: hypothetical protein ABIH41_02745 [Nanoarchaeota archaeon]